ncbi:hypothetical protein JCM5350_006551, partial [Sporobolomyces pararoseus]
MPTTTDTTIAPFEQGGPSPKPSSDAVRPLRDQDYVEDDEEEAEEAELLEKTVKRQRSGSILSFDFSNRLILEASEQVERASGGNRDDEKISLVSGIALIVGLVIGSGIFASSGVVAREVGSVGASLIVWVLSGCLSWAGGSSLAELGSALPQNGGSQVYLAAAYGPLPSYCFSLTAVTALKPGSQAIISIIAGEYICRVLWHTAFSDDPQKAVRGVPTAAIKGVAIICLLIVSSLQAWSTKAGKSAQVVTTLFKVVAIFVIFIAGVVWLLIGKIASSFSFEGSTHQPTGYALALFSALW